MKTIQDVMALSSGLTRELYEFIKSITRPVPEFQAATSLAIVSGACQGSFEWPTGELPSDYFLLIGKSSVTKSNFLEIAIKLLTEATPPELLPTDICKKDRGPVCAKATAEEQLHQRLEESPNRVIVGDEMGKILEGAYLKNKPQDVVRRDFLLRHYNGSPIPAHTMRTEGKSLGAVNQPRITALAALVEHQWQAIIDHGDIVYDGFISRWAVFPFYDSLPLRTVAKPKWKSPKAIVKQLRTLIEASIIPVDVSSPDAIGFAPQKIMQDHPERHATFLRLVRDLEEQRSYFDPDFEEMIAPIRDRIMSRLDKFTYTHAAGCGRSAVEPQDCIFAYELCHWLWAQALKLFKAKETHFDRVCAAVVDWLRTEGVSGEAYSESKIFLKSGRNILRTAKKKLGESGPERVLASLVRNGAIIEVQRGIDPGNRGGNRRVHVQYAINPAVIEGMTRQERNQQDEIILADMRQNVNSSLPEPNPKVSWLRRPVANAKNNL